MHIKTSYFFILLSVLFLTSCVDSKKNSDSKNTKITVKDTVKQNVEENVQQIDSATLANKLNKIPHHYICYTSDDDSSPQLSITFNAASNALYVRYKGQNDSIPLKNIKEDFQNSGAYPTITQFYDEMHNGKKTGTYELTHSGNWDYAKYIRDKDGKIFKFTIDHDQTVVDGNYRLTPCFE